jgi:tyrosine-protein kinase Etk/Wzc
MTSTPSTNSTHPEVSRSDEIDIGQLIGLLLDRWVLILSTIVLFTIAGLFYAFSATPIYQSDSLIQVEEEKQGLDVAAMLGGELGTSGSSTKAEIEIIQSRMVLGEAVERTATDIRVTENRMPLIGKFLTNLGFQSGPLGMGYGYSWASDSLTVTRFDVPEYALNLPHLVEFSDADTFTLSLDGSVVLEGRVGESTSDTEGLYRIFIQTKRGPSAGSFTITRMDQLSAIEELKERLGVSERGKDTGILSVTLDSTSRREASETLRQIAQIFLKQNVDRLSEEAERQLEFLEKQIPSVRSELELSENNLNAYRARNDSVDLTFETQSLLEQLVRIENQLTELEFAEAEISQQFTKNHPRYEALLTKRKRLNDEKIKLDERVNELPSTQQEVLRLTRDATVNQEIFVALLNSQQEMSLVKAGTIGNIRILDPAATQPKPIQPRKALIIVLATLLGGLLGVGWVLIARALHRGIENPDELEDLGLPVYASVPLATFGLRDRIKKQRLFQKQTPLQLRKRDLVAVYEPADPVVESIRGLRTSLHFGLLESPDNRILITGPSPGVGKSFVAANLAVTMAQGGQRVLIIDTDLRKGRLHKIFGIKKPGLTEVLGQKLSSAEAIQTVPEIEGLDVMTRGDTPPNPSELLMTPSLGEMLGWASEQYDTVIVDSPPVLAVTDAVIVGQLCGMALMISRFSESAPKEVMVATSRLRQNGVNLRGSILNAVEKRASSYYGYGGYYAYDYRKTDSDD